MRSRRRLLKSSGAIGVVALSGCVDRFPSGDEIPYIGESDGSDSDVDQESIEEEPIPDQADEVDAINHWGEEFEPVDGPPEDVVEMFYASLYSGDIETTNELIHPESAIPMFTQGVAEEFQIYRIQVGEYDRVQDSNVVVTIRYSFVLVDPHDNVDRNSNELTLRKNDNGAWRIYE